MLTGDSLLEAVRDALACAAINGHPFGATYSAQQVAEDLPAYHSDLEDCDLCELSGAVTLARAMRLTVRARSEIKTAEPSGHKVDYICDEGLGLVSVVAQLVRIVRDSQGHEAALIVAAAAVAEAKR